MPYAARETRIRSLVSGSRLRERARDASARENVRVWCVRGVEPSVRLRARVVCNSPSGGPAAPVRSRDGLPFSLRARSVPFPMAQVGVYAKVDVAIISHVSCRRVCVCVRARARVCEHVRVCVCVCARVRACARSRARAEFLCLVTL